MVACWKCQKEFPLMGRIGFRASCDYCGIDLHCCKGCRFYAPGRHNDCFIPGTEPIKDRERSNFCEEFLILLPKASQSVDPKESKHHFDDLFQ